MSNKRWKHELDLTPTFLDTLSNKIPVRKLVETVVDRLNNCPKVGDHAQQVAEWSALSQLKQPTIEQFNSQMASLYGWSDANSVWVKTI